MIKSRDESQAAFKYEHMWKMQSVVHTNTKHHHGETHETKKNIVQFLQNFSSTTADSNNKISLLSKSFKWFMI